ncbi:uncharacterized protein LOC144343668 [Saccoglossus kowalevskii]
MASRAHKPMNWKYALCSSGFSIALFFLIFTMFYVNSKYPTSRAMISMYHANGNHHKDRGPNNHADPKEVHKANLLRAIAVENITRHVVVDNLEKQEDGYGFLKPHDVAVIPNIAHFGWFSCSNFRFENLISILSVHRIMRAERILFHTDCEPHGEWWNQAKRLVPVLEIVQTTPPTEVFGKTLNPNWPEHAVEVARLRILMDIGGVFMDRNTFIVSSLDPLRYYDYVFARSGLNSSNGVILATDKSDFLSIYFESYQNYDEGCRNCIFNTRNELSKQFSELIHVESTTVVTHSQKFAWKESFLIDVQENRKHVKKKEEFTSQNIKKLDSAFGEICRYVYYGSEQLAN